MSTTPRGVTRVGLTIASVCFITCAACAGIPQLTSAAQLGGSGSDSATAVCSNATNVFVSGFFSGTADIDPSTGVHNVASIGNTDVFVTKISTEGDFVWGVNIGGLQSDLLMGIDVDSTGSVIIVGSFSGMVDFDPGIGVVNRTSTGDTDFFVLKLSIDGEFVWVKTLGGSDDDSANSVAVDQNDNVYVCGRFMGSINFNPNGSGGSANSNGDNDFFVIKLRSSGEFIWAKAIGGESAEEANSLCIDSTGNVVIVGNFGAEVDFDPGPDESIIEVVPLSVFVLKLTPKGKFVFAVHVEPETTSNAYAVDTDSANSIYLTGMFKGTADFDPGDGEHELNSDATFGDAFFLKLTSDGLFQFAGAIESDLLSTGESISVDQFGNCFVGGAFRNTPDFDSSAGTANMTSAGVDDAFLLQLDNFGNYVWAGKMGSTNNDSIFAINTDREGNVLACGSFSGMVDFDPNAGTETLTASGSDAFFISLEYLQRGDVTVKIKPRAARKDGARWRLDDDPTFRKSGAVIEDVLEGAHTIRFKNIPGWGKPNDKEIVVDPNVTNSATGKYTL